MHDVGARLRDLAKTEPVLSIQPGGNFGDSLIYRGFENIQRDADLTTVPFREGRIRNDSPRSLPSANLLTIGKYLSDQLTHVRHRVRTAPGAVYIQGGGNFNDVWGSGIRCYRTVARYFDCPIVIGPQSCYFPRSNPSAIFEEVDNQTHLFCRERYSAEIMRTAGRGFDHVSIQLAPDTALSLSRADLPVSTVEPEYSLVAMRSDTESASPTLQTDIPAPVFVTDPSVSAGSFEDFIATVARASHIFTDRLHVAILASILEIPVTWYGVRYHKSRGVYEYSLRDSDDITFVPQREATA